MMNLNGYQISAVPQPICDQRLFTGSLLNEMTAMPLASSSFSWKKRKRCNVWAGNSGKSCVLTILRGRKEFSEVVFWGRAKTIRIPLEIPRLLQILAGEACGKEMGEVPAQWSVELALWCHEAIDWSPKEARFGTMDERNSWKCQPGD